MSATFFIYFNSNWIKNVLTIQAVRNKIADYMRDDEILHQLPAFQEQKDETLRSYPSLTWSTYLQQLRLPKIIWGDELVLLCASLLFGKEIIVVTTKQQGVACWYKAAQRNIDWPFPYTEPPLVLGNLHERHFESIHRIGYYTGSQVPVGRSEQQLDHFSHDFSPMLFLPWLFTFHKRSWKSIFINFS